MASPSLVQYTRNLAAMIRVHGPDPKGLKMRSHAFHHYSNGQTTLSASGMLLPESLTDCESVKQLLGSDCDGFQLIVTVASVVEPYLTLHHRQGNFQNPPELIPGARIDVMLEGKSIEDGEGSDPGWRSARVVKLVNVPGSAAAVQSIMEASCGLIELGWSLASFGNSSNFTDYNRKDENGLSFQLGEHVPSSAETKSPSSLAQSTTRMAILAVSFPGRAKPNLTVSSSYKRGESILAVGSPFGVLSPLHFFNSLSKGSIANCYYSTLSSASLLMVDIRCLPGMEGGPVFREPADLVGFLIRPLRQTTTGAEIQLVIPWKAVAAACSDLLLAEHPSKSDIVLAPNCCSSHAIENSLSSICLISIDGGVWASGIMLNKQGLIITNAHLLEPWRFGKATINSVFEDGSKFKFDPSRQNSRRIRVRLGIAEPWIWINAKVVYICKGPLDVALLQLTSLPEKLLASIEVDLATPSSGMLAYVFGHGLLGPKCEFSPSVCSGVVAKVVRARAPPYLQSNAEVPVMLQTTAAVHPGGSGGAVINFEGRMIGLVTSNARHGGGTVIPHLNFSIPCGVLLPIFQFAKDMEDASLLRSLDQPNGDLSSIWALVSPEPPKLKAVERNTEEKGSKFAKFLAERDQLLNADMLQIINKLPKESIPSKL